MGLRVFMAVATALFSLLILAYAMRMREPDWMPVPHPMLLWWNTGALVLASLAMAQARRTGARQAAWLLAGYGVAGLLAMGLVARPGDRRPKATIVACMAGLTMVFAVLAALASGPVSASVTVPVGVIAILGWGATATAVPPLLQTAAMRHSPEDPDGASGLYVAAFQIGIMAGSLLGGLLFEHAGESLMLTASAVLIASALVSVAAGRDLFAVTPVPSEK